MESQTCLLIHIHTVYIQKGYACIRVQNDFCISNQRQSNKVSKRFFLFWQKKKKKNRFVLVGSLHIPRKFYCKKTMLLFYHFLHIKKGQCLRIEEHRKRDEICFWCQIDVLTHIYPIHSRWIRLHIMSDFYTWILCT